MSAPLSEIFEGWDGYQASLVPAVKPLTSKQLLWRPAEGMKSTGEVVLHIAYGRIGWFSNMGVPEAKRLADEYGNLAETDEIAADAAALVSRLERSWEMVNGVLKAWTVDDLRPTYPHEYWGKTYAVSHQWTIFRILAHDIHHGGQLSLMLGMQGIDAPGLIALGGHITEPPLWDGGPARTGTA